MIKQLAQQFPTTKKLHTNRTAADSPVETAYIEYMRLSLDAVHCSVTALGRHLSSEPVEGRPSLTVSVEARTSPAELLETVLHACRALTGVMVGANGLVGFTSESGKVEALVSEFERNGWARVR